MKGLVHRGKYMCMCTLAKSGVLILLCAYTFAIRLVQCVENTAQSSIPRRNQSKTVLTAKSLHTMTPAVAQTDSTFAFATEGHPKLQLSFESIETIARLGEDADVFRIGTIVKEIQISHKRTHSATMVTLESASISKSSEGSCCLTDLSFAVLSTVVSEYTRATYNVKHYDTSKQAITLGKCASLGDSCSLSGTCQVTNRIQFVLVELGNGSDVFFPVSIPNHCYCRNN